MPPADANQRCAPLPVRRAARRRSAAWLAPMATRPRLGRDRSAGRGCAPGRCRCRPARSRARTLRAGRRGAVERPPGRCRRRRPPRPGRGRRPRRRAASSSASPRRAGDVELGIGPMREPLAEPRRAAGAPGRDPAVGLTMTSGAFGTRPIVRLASSDCEAVAVIGMERGSMHDRARLLGTALGAFAGHRRGPVHAPAAHGVPARPSGLLRQPRRRADGRRGRRGRSAAPGRAWRLDHRRRRRRARRGRAPLPDRAADRRGRAAGRSTSSATAGPARAPRTSCASSCPARSSRCAPRRREPFLAGADLVAVVIGSNDATHHTPPGRFRGRPARDPRGDPRRGAGSAGRAAPASRRSAARCATLEPLIFITDQYARLLRPIGRAEAERAGVAYADLAARGPAAHPRADRRPVARPIPSVGRRLHRVGRRDRRGAPARAGRARDARARACRRLTRASAAPIAVAARRLRCDATRRSEPHPRAPGGDPVRPVLVLVILLATLLASLGLAAPAAASSRRQGRRSSSGRSARS